MLKKGARTLFFCRFLKNAVPCRFSLLKFYNFYIFYLTDSQVMTKTIFTKSYHGTKYKGGTSLKAKSCRKILHLSLCSQTAKKIPMPWYAECHSWDMSNSNATKYHEIKIGILDNTCFKENVPTFEILVGWILRLGLNFWVINVVLYGWKCDPAYLIRYKLSPT